MAPVPSTTAGRSSPCCWCLSAPSTPTTLVSLAHQVQTPSRPHPSEIQTPVGGTSRPEHQLHGLPSLETQSPNPEGQRTAHGPSSKPQALAIPPVLSCSPILKDSSFFQKSLILKLLYHPHLLLQTSSSYKTIPYI